MTEQKKICLVIPSLQVGGMERVMSLLINHFHSNYSCSIHLVIYGRRPEFFYKIPETVIIHQPSFIFNDKYRKWNTIKTIFFLRKILKGLKADSILSFGEHWNNLVLLSLLGLKLPVFVSDRCQPDKSLGRVQDFLRKKLYPTAKGIIAQTHTAKQIYLQQFQHSNIQVIGNPIRKVESSKPIQKENIVLTVGRLIRTKHHDELIKTFIKVRQPGWRLVIVGDDALKQNNKIRLTQLIKDLNATDFVELAGKQSDVETYYLKSKIFAFTSSSEGFPNVIGEAQSAGLPVIAFDCIAGPAELIEDGVNGFLIPLFNYPLFEEKLKELIANDELRQQMGLAAEKSVKKFEDQKIAAQFYDFITTT